MIFHFDEWLDYTKRFYVTFQKKFYIIEGIIVVECRDVRTGESTGQLVIDILTDAVLQHNKDIHGTIISDPEKMYILNINFPTGRILCQRLLNTGVQYSKNIGCFLCVIGRGGYGRTPQIVISLLLF